LVRLNLFFAHDLQLITMTRDSGTNFLITLNVSLYLCSLYKYTNDYIQWPVTGPIISDHIKRDYSKQILRIEQGTNQTCSCSILSLLLVKNYSLIWFSAKLITRETTYREQCSGWTWKFEILFFEQNQNFTFIQPPKP